MEPKHKAKPSKKASVVRSARNKASGKYTRQRARTEANKARRIARQMARFPAYEIPKGWIVLGVSGKVVRAPLA